MRKIVISILFICSFMFGDFFDDGFKAYNAKNYSKAVNLYNKACDNKDAIGCHNLGFMYYNGQGVKKNSNKALDLFKKACDLNYEGGCKAYAIIKEEVGK